MDDVLRGEGNRERKGTKRGREQREEGNRERKGTERGREQREEGNRERKGTELLDMLHLWRVHES